MCKQKRNRKRSFKPREIVQSPTIPAVRVMQFNSDDDYSEIPPRNEHTVQGNHQRDYTYRASPQPRPDIPQVPQQRDYSYRVSPQPGPDMAQVPQQSEYPYRLSPQRRPDMAQQINFSNRVSPQPMANDWRHQSQPTLEPFYSSVGDARGMNGRQDRMQSQERVLEGSSERLDYTQDGRVALSQRQYTQELTQSGDIDTLTI